MQHHILPEFTSACLPKRIVVRRLCSAFPLAHQSSSMFSPIESKRSQKRVFIIHSFQRLVSGSRLIRNEATGCACSSVLEPPAVSSASAVVSHRGQFTSRHSSQGGDSPSRVGWLQKAIQLHNYEASALLNTTRSLSLGSSHPAHTNRVGLCVCVCVSRFLEEVLQRM